MSSQDEEAWIALNANPRTSPAAAAAWAKLSGVHSEPAGVSVSPEDYLVRISVGFCEFSAAPPAPVYHEPKRCCAESVLVFQPRRRLAHSYSLSFPLYSSPLIALPELPHAIAVRAPIDGRGRGSKCAIECPLV